MGKMTSRTVELFSVMDRENSAIMARELAEYVSQSLPTNISGSQVDQIGQAGLQLLVSVAKTASKLELPIQLTDPSESLTRAIQLAGLADALSIITAKG
jgi:anti-anti-sigma regulatory factor